MISISRVEILCCYYNTGELGKTLGYKGLRQLRLISFQWTSGSEAGLWIWIWICRLGFSLEIFCFFYFILSEFLTKNVLECIVNPIYLIGCSDYTLISLVPKTIVLIFNTTHKMECCKCWYWLGWYNLW